MNNCFSIFWCSAAVITTCASVGTQRLFSTFLFSPLLSVQQFSMLASRIIRFDTYLRWVSFFKKNIVSSSIGCRSRPSPSPHTSTPRLANFSAEGSSGAAPSQLDSTDVKEDSTVAVDQPEMMDMKGTYFGRGKADPTKLSGALRYVLTEAQLIDNGFLLPSADAGSSSTPADRLGFLSTLASNGAVNFTGIHICIKTSTSQAFHR